MPTNNINDHPHESTFEVTPKVQVHNTAPHFEKSFDVQAPVVEPIVKEDSFSAPRISINPKETED